MQLLRKGKTKIRTSTIVAVIGLVFLFTPQQRLFPIFSYYIYKNPKLRIIGGGIPKVLSVAALWPHTKSLSCLFYIQDFLDFFFCFVFCPVLLYIQFPAVRSRARLCFPCSSSVPFLSDCFCCCCCCCP